MRLNSILCSLVVFTMVLSANIYAAKRHGSAEVSEALAARPDVRKGPMYFYCQGDEVVIENCQGRETAPGEGCSKTLKYEDERKKLQRKIKKSEFMEALLSQIIPSRIGELSPLKSQDVQNFARREEYNKGETEKERKVRIDMMVEVAKEAVDLLETMELKNINDKNHPYYVRYKDAMQRLKDFQQELENKKDVSAAEMNASIEAVKKAVAGVVDLVCDKSVVPNLNDLAHEGTLLDTVLKKYDPNPLANYETLANGRLKLLNREYNTRTYKYDAFWKDTTTSLIWGPVTTEKMKYEDAKTYCAGLKDMGMKWEIPNKEDFLSALANPESEKLAGTKGREYSGRNYSLRDNLPGLKADRELWSSSSNSTGIMDCFNGVSGKMISCHVDNPITVRCVSRGA